MDHVMFISDIVNPSATMCVKGECVCKVTKPIALKKNDTCEHMRVIVGDLFPSHVTTVTRTFCGRSPNK